jgi:hypothetical protein
MEDKINELKSLFPSLNFEKVERRVVIAPGNVELRTHYLVKGLRGNEELTLSVLREENLEDIKRLLEKNVFVFKDFLAIYYDGKVEILLSPIRSASLLNLWDRETRTLVEAEMYYHETKITATIVSNPPNTLLSLLARRIRFSRYELVFRRPTILILHNLSHPTRAGIVTDTRNILNSILFDIEYSYSLAFETVNIENLIRRSLGRRRVRTELPEEAINLVYKKYIPELIEYFHIGYKVDYLPFKYMCYFHIIEYFSDRSAYQVVAQQIKNIILKPDFHLKMSDYVNQAINVFKKETDKYTTDKIKINRVLRQFIDMSELKEYFESLNILDHFAQSATLHCSKPLVLPAVDFSSENNFYDTLARRIYSLRCSIVHSNPDFDESKAVPFVPSPENIEVLRKDIDMVSEVARTIITKSAEP